MQVTCNNGTSLLERRFSRISQFTERETVRFHGRGLRATKPSPFRIRALKDHRHLDNNRRAASPLSSNLQWAPIFAARARMLENPNPSLLAACESAMPDPLSMTSKNEIRRTAAKINTDDRWLGMANRIAHRFLGNSQEILLNRGG